MPRLGTHCIAFSLQLAFAAATLHALRPIGAQRVHDPAIGSEFRAFYWSRITLADEYAPRHEVGWYRRSVRIPQTPPWLGRRVVLTVGAADFFSDYLQTALAPDELLVEVRVPKLGDGWGFHYEKFHRVAQAWAIVGVAAAVKRSNGSIAEARIGLTQCTGGGIAGVDHAASSVHLLGV